MVEDISFPKNVPKVSRARRVKRTARQNEEKQKQPFKEYLNQNEDELQEGEDGQGPQKKKKTPSPRAADHEQPSDPTADKPHKSDDDTQGKRIDVHA